MNRTAKNRTAKNRTAASRTVVSRTLGLVLGTGLVFSACTTGTDSDLADADSATIGSAPVGSDAGNDGSAGQGDEFAIGTESIGGRSGSIDESEPDLAMATDQGFSETPAEEPTTESNPQADEESLIEVPQAGLGGGESVLCASVQIGLDAVRDGATEMVEQQRSRLIDGISSITDGELVTLIESIDGQSMNERVLSGALDRCENLGYES